MKAGLNFFEFYSTFANVFRKYDFLFSTMYDNKMLHFNKVSQFYNISATGNETWCATVTKPESLEVDGDNWGLCMDEKSLAYDGGTAGEPCSFPFLMNEK